MRTRYIRFDIVGASGVVVDMAVFFLLSDPKVFASGAVSPVSQQKFFCPGLLGVQKGKGHAHQGYLLSRSITEDCLDRARR
jgi:hypothetical protein